MSHRTCGSRPPCTRHPIHACALVCFVVVDFSSPVSVLYFVPPLSFRPFQMSSSEFHERSRSYPLCDFRLGTVATSDHETPLTVCCQGDPCPSAQFPSGSDGGDSIGAARAELGTQKCRDQKHQYISRDDRFCPMTSPSGCRTNLASVTGHVGVFICNLIFTGKASWTRRLGGTRQRALPQRLQQRRQDRHATCCAQ